MCFSMLMFVRVFVGVNVCVYLSDRDGRLVGESRSRYNEKKRSDVYCVFGASSLKFKYAVGLGEG